jgi:hypothetical protein
MKHACLLMVMFVSVPHPYAAQIGMYQRGTIVRMRMSECLLQRGVMASLSGAPQQQKDELCPEYTLVTDKVVYVIVGKMSNELLPLAETTDFRFRKNELLVRVDDDRHEARFKIKEMTLRRQWELEEQRHQERAAPPAASQAEPAVSMSRSQ